MDRPLITVEVAQRLHAAAADGVAELELSLDLGRTRDRIQLDAAGWHWRGARYPLPGDLRERTVYFWDGARFEPAARWSGTLVKLVPTEWGPPTFEIDGIKMLPTARVSPLEDARRKVALVAPRGRTLLDTCGGLGYFAACCLEAGVARLQSFEKNPDVSWLRSLNPWSPPPDPRLVLTPADVSVAIRSLPDAAFDAALHDPPRFGIAGELYSLAFYEQLARVLRPGAPLFHYTGTPNQRSRGRDLPGEVATRLHRAGFDTRREGDGVLARRRR